MGEVKNKKLPMIIAAIIAVVIIAVIVIVLLFSKKGYRTIKLLDFFGTVTYDRGNDVDVPVYEGMAFKSGR